MQPINRADAAIGWGLIIGLGLLCFYGVPFAIRLIVQRIAAASGRQRVEREQIEEELDELARQELLSMVNEEHREQSSPSC